MKFTALQDNLRKALLRRIEEGELTGIKLAKQVGVEQGHISNFLNRKRGLSLDAMDRVLSSQKKSPLPEHTFVSGIQVQMLMRSQRVLFPSRMRQLY